MSDDNRARGGPARWQVAVALGIACLVFGVLAYGTSTGAFLLICALFLLAGGVIARVLQKT